MTYSADWRCQPCGVAWRGTNAECWSCEQRGELMQQPRIPNPYRPNPAHVATV